MLAQAKSMRSTWLVSRSGGARRVMFQGAKKRPTEGKELNDLVANTVKAVLTTRTHKKPRPQVT